MRVVDWAIGMRGSEQLRVTSWSGTVGAEQNERLRMGYRHFHAYAPLLLFWWAHRESGGAATDLAEEPALVGEVVRVAWEAAVAARVRCALHDFGWEWMRASMGLIDRHGARTTRDALLLAEYGGARGGHGRLQEEEGGLWVTHDDGTPAFLPKQLFNDEWVMHGGITRAFDPIYRAERRRRAREFVCGLARCALIALDTALNFTLSRCLRFVLVHLMCTTMGLSGMADMFLLPRHQSSLATLPFALAFTLWFTPAQLILALVPDLWTRLKWLASTETAMMTPTAWAESLFRLLVDCLAWLIAQAWRLIDAVRADPCLLEPFPFLPPQCTMAFLSSRHACDVSLNSTAFALPLY
jgi:hypothetical protein